MNSNEWVRLGKEAQANGLFDQAVDYYNQALNERIKTCGEYHPEASFIYSNIGSIFFKKKDYAMAAQNMYQALQGFHRVCSPDHPLLAQTCNNLGLALAGQGEYDKAIQFFERAHQIARQSGMRDMAHEIERKIKSLFSRMGQAVA
ncbi:hypothetical protein NITGR_1050034 [Nitrospina gracilis 3/211]|uniref:Uncharacterized protein n=1 Tax=Nitrospina gracilis (strain 3/211) TaxID=1266370 RepID=M1YVX9_NITG3|nr:MULTISPECIES: tetratricopeptide repeat protein [Nitrospina]MCF8722270.1 tetratricopeptide (TPR) repeat protein [Nitrospina sp. Nb-3]CCQ89471.1 hypothetical protein NITGR_1050034 [Nitrospina gracilis 3/211]